MDEIMLVENPRKRKKRTTRKRRTRRPKARTRTVTKTVYRNRYRKNPRRRRTYRRNPGFKFMGVDLVETAGGTVIGIGSKLLPGYLKRFGLPLPTTGALKYITQFASGAALSWVVGNFLKQKPIARKGMEITTALVFADIANDLLLGSPAVQGLFGLGKKTVYMEGYKGLGRGRSALGAGVYESLPTGTGNERTSRFANRMG